jgi:hypothetical protein
VGQYTKRGEPTTPKQEEEAIILDISIDRGRYLYTLITKKHLEKLGIKTPGIYRLKLKINGETYQTYLNIKKIKKQKINLPREFNNRRRVTIISLEKQTVEKVLESLKMDYNQGKIGFFLTKDGDKLKLCTSKFMIDVDNYKIRVFGGALLFDLEIKQDYRSIPLQLRIFEDHVDLYYKAGEDDYFKVKTLHSIEDIAVLVYERKDRGRLVDRHVYIISPRRIYALESLMKKIKVRSFIYEKDIVFEGEKFKVYRMELSEEDKLRIDAYLDHTYELDYFYRKNDRANLERERVGFKIADDFLMINGWNIWSDQKNLSRHGRFGIDRIVNMNGELCLLEVKATEPSYINKAMKKALREIKHQAYDLYSSQINNLTLPVKYLGIIIVSYHYSWRYLNKYRVYFWRGRYEP